MRKTILILAILTSLFIHLAHCQSLQEQFDAIFSDHNFENSPGFAVLVAKDNQVLYRKAFGYANLELDVILTPEHIFRIGSITKQFTAAAILKLAEEHKLSLSDNITSYIKDYPTQGHTITIEHLLTHTSGIKSYTGMRTWDATARKKDFTPSELVDFFKNEPMDFAPGEKYSYNNSGYFLLGYIIEQVSGKPYQEYIEEEIFAPVGMVHSYYDNSSRIIKNRAHGYQRTRTGFQNADFISMTQPYAAGSLMSTVDDLYKWYTAVMNDQVITSESRRKAHSTYILNNGEATGYAYGWSLGNIHGSPVIEHGGGIHGFQSASIYLPEEKIFVAVLSNCMGLDPQLPAQKLAAAAAGKPFAWQELTMKNQELNQYTGVFESDDKDTRTIVTENDSLFYVLKTGRRFRLKPFEKDQFFADNQLTEYVFNTNEQGNIISFTEKGTGYSSLTWNKTEKPINIRKEITLSSFQLEKYVGTYELMPDLLISVFKENDKIFVRVGDQEKLQIVPSEPDRFFSKQVPVEFTFHYNDDDMITKLIVHQNGEHEARKIQ